MKFNQNNKNEEEKLEHVSKLKERNIKSKENDVEHIVDFIVVFRFERFFKPSGRMGWCLHHTLTHTLATFRYCSVCCKYIWKFEPIQCVHIMCNGMRYMISSFSTMQNNYNRLAGVCV